MDEGTSIVSEAERINYATSANGTRIGWATYDQGPSLILVSGVSAGRNRWQGAIPILARQFTVCAVDRRGRGASEDGLPQADLQKGKADGESDLLAKIAEMPEPDRAMAERLHAIIKASAPTFSPKTWYGMPAYANKDGKVVCFFQSAHKFKARYATLGFNDAANLDEGAMWPISFALKELTATEEARIIELVKKAVG